MSKSQVDQYAAFDAAYATLNTEQKKAVDTIEGPVMVIAGPGTGKTQILTLRIANILRNTDSNPSNILALTFTDAGAKAMRERLASFVGDAAYDVTITTFHSFADKIIRLYPEAYEKIIGGRAATSIEQLKIIESILDDTSFKALRPSGDPRYYTKAIIGAIQDLKQEYLSPDDLKKHIEAQETNLLSIEQFHEKGAHKGKERGEYKDAVKYIDRNKELLLIYQQYESAMRADKLFDFEDMIVETVRSLEGDENMLRDLQEQYQYVLADEHQDVNGSQNKILELLTSFHDQPNLFVVGDEKQAIYRFQGASLDNFLYFETAFKNATIISLVENYRSGQVVLDAAQNLIETEDPTLAPLRVPLNAALVTSAEVSLADFTHEAVEQDWLVQSVQQDIESGIDPAEIAVIVRTNKEVESVTAQMRKQGISVSPSADSDILSHPLTHKLATLIGFFTTPSDALLVELLHQPFMKLSFADMASLLHMRSKDRSLLQICSDEEIVTELPGAEGVKSFFAALEHVRTYLSLEPPHRILERLITETGFLDTALMVDPLESSRVVRRIYDEVEGMVVRGEVLSVQDVVTQFTLHREYNVALNAPYIHTGEQSVQVMTAHKSKGLEFAKVYIPRLVDRVWGKKQSRNYFELPLVKHDTSGQDVFEDDERRLLYVAMTRAKTELVLTCANENIEGKEQIKSRFLGDFEEDVTTLDVTDFSNAFSGTDGLKSNPSYQIDSSIAVATLQNRGLSPTALNNFLKSPWEYLYRNVLRIPQVKTTELQFGTAVHAVLDEAVRSQTFTSDFLSKSLKQALSLAALSDNEFVRLHQRGLEALNVFIEDLKQTDSKDSKTEFHLEAKMQTGLEDLPELKLNGNLDRVDYKDGKIIKVIDYKTGKPKTRNHIEGKTKTSNGDYKRQLVFYALLLSLQSDTDKHSRTGVLSFVEPDKNGVSKEEVFEITDEEIADLKTEIIESVSTVVSGKAFEVPCDPEMSHYCHLVDAWKKT